MKGGQFLLLFIPHPFFCPSMLKISGRLFYMEQARFLRAAAMMVKATPTIVSSSVA